MINKNRISFFLVGVFSSLFILLACNDSISVSTLVVHEIYNVEGDETTKKPTTLRYKDSKHYDEGNNLVQQNFYEVDNTLKGYEFIKKEGAKAVTNYYDSDSNLLAIYNLNYTDNLISERVAYDGITKEILRSESYLYNDQGDRTQKTIYNPSGKLMNTFKMKYDTDGNEVEFEHLNSAGAVTSKEVFSIAKVDDQRRWLERWGYKNGEPSSFHRRSFSK